MCAEAIAAGCSIVLKPPSADPLIMLKVAEIATEAGLPAGALSVIPTARDVADRLVEDERFRDVQSISILGVRSVLCIPLREREQTHVVPGSYELRPVNELRRWHDSYVTHWVEVRTPGRNFGKATTAGGTGKVYFDDIRLYRPTTP